MSTSERNGSAESATESGELPVGLTHLLAASDALSPGRWGAQITLCGAELCAPSATAAEDEGGELSPDDVRYCEDCVRQAKRYEGGHPSWCSPGHCYRQDDDGLRVHVQRPVRWVDDTGEVQFTSGLVHPEDDCTYLELSVKSPRLRTYFAHVVLSLAGARRLRDQLSAHDRDAHHDNGSPEAPASRGAPETGEGTAR